MADQITVTYKGRNYVWNGRHWYGADDYGIPPTGVQNYLNRLAADKFAAEDARISNPTELANLARIAREAGQVERAKALAEKAYSLDPTSVGELRHSMTTYLGKNSTSSSDS